jgi:acetylornithine deacetylase
VDAHRDSYVALLRDLVRATQDGEASVQQVVTDRLRALGCEVETLPYFPQELSTDQQFADESAMDTAQRMSLVGHHPGQMDARSLLFFAHPDSEPVETSDWVHDPFAGEIEDGRLYGWGVADDLLGVATMVCALEAVDAAALAPVGSVTLVSAPSKRVARGVISVLDHGYVADAALYLHPAESGAGLHEIKAFASGELWFRVTVPGRLPGTQEPGHTAFAHRAVNPLDKAWVLYHAFQSLAERRAQAVHHPLLDEAVGRSTNILLSYMQCGTAEKLSRVSPACVIAGSVTFPPGDDLGAVQNQIAEALRQAAQADEWLREHPPELEWLIGINAVEVPLDHPLYRTVAQAVAQVTGCEPHVNPLHSASDIRNPILQKGIPTVGLGSLAGNFSVSGGHDEWVDVEDYVQAIKVVSTATLDWCGWCERS